MELQSLLNKTFKLLLSLSVFSLLSIWFSPWIWILFLLRSLKFCFLTFPLRLFTHAIDRKCIFLLFNGLVLIATSLGLISSSNSTSDHINNHLDESNKEFPPPALLLRQQISTVEIERDGGEEEEEDGQSNSLILVNDQNGAPPPIELLNREEETKAETEEAANDKAQVENDVQMLSIDELNRKFEDFITKTKQEIRLEAQLQLLVLVN